MAHRKAGENGWGNLQRERGTLGKSQAEEIHHQVMEEVECMKLRRGNQPRLRERERENSTNRSI